MTLLQVMFAIQLLSLDKAIEAAGKEAKPVVLYLHKGDGGDLAKRLEDAFGEQAAKFHFAERNCKDDPDGAAELYGVSRIDGVIIFLDPGLTTGPAQVLSRFDGEGQDSEEKARKELEKSGMDALRAFHDNQGCRAVFKSWLEAARAGDVKAIREKSWLKNPQASDDDLRTLIAETLADVKECESFEFESVIAREPNIRGMKESTKDFECYYRLKTLCIRKEKAPDGGYLGIVKAGGTFRIVL